MIYVKLKNETILTINKNEVNVLRNELLPFRFRGKNKINPLSILNFFYRRGILIYTKTLEIFRKTCLSIQKLYCFDFLTTTHGLSITDCYWVTTKKDDTYEKILFNCTNKHFKLFMRDNHYAVFYDCKNINDIFFLYKHRNIKKEFIADQLLTSLNVNHVSHYYVNDVTCKSKSMCNKQFSFVSISDIQQYCIDKKIDIKQFVLNIDKHGIYILCFAAYLLDIFDFNNNNIGIMMDNDTGRLVAFAPMFDNEMIFLHNTSASYSPLLKNNMFSIAKKAAAEFDFSIKLPKKDLFKNEKRYKLFIKRFNTLQHLAKNKESNNYG